MNRHLDLHDMLAPYGDGLGDRASDTEGHGSLHTDDASNTDPRELSGGNRSATTTTRSQRLAERRARIRRRVRRTTGLLVAVVSSIVGLTAASAYFTSTGSGSGAASTGTLQPVTATGAVASSFLPDGSTRTVNLTVTNPNNFAVKLVSVTGNGTITPDAGHAGCSPTGVTFTDQTGMSVSIPANASNSPVALSGAAAMGVGSANACQGATFTIPVTVKVQKP